MNPINYSHLANTVHVINNSNRPWGTLIEEIPSDVGRSYEGYKRGGILEGAEKMRKELMAAAVWMFGIPGINKVCNFVGEKFFKIPMGMDYSNAKEGNDAIKDSLNYIINGVNPKGKDVSELAKYNKKNIFSYSSLIKKSAFQGLSPEECVEKMAKRAKTAKQLSSLIAVVANCALLGWILPKINQAMTKKKMDKMTQSETMLKAVSIDDYISNIRKSDNIAFRGKLADTWAKIPKNPDDFTFATENNNTFRLVITDIPMIIGRMATSRNKYEALEYLVMDGGSIFFYNFSSGLIQKLLRNKNGIPDVNPRAAEAFVQADEMTILEAVKNIKTAKKATDILPKSITDEIYKQATYGKYGKINKFIKDTEMDSIDNGVIELLKKVKEAAQKQGIQLDDLKTKELDEASVKNTAKMLKDIAKTTVQTVNKSNALYLALGLMASVVGLAVIIPKLTFLITKLITGKNEFTGIANYDDNNVKKS